MTFSPRPDPGAARGVYLDHAATTPMSARARAAMIDELGRTGNPSAIHAAGRAARRTVEEAREAVAASLGAHPSEVIFTGGGTEADNLAVKGLYWGRTAADPGLRRVLISAVEHHAVLDAAGWLGARQGADVVRLPVDRLGRLDLGAIGARLAADPGATALVSVMWANNEVGTVQPVGEVVRAAHAHGVPVHIDAVQALGQLEVDFGAAGADGPDALSISGHKVGGPAGVGALLVRRGAPIEPVLHGGGQERGLRSGSLDVPGIRAFAVAVADAVAERARRAGHLAALRDALMAGVRAAVPGAVLCGPEPGSAEPGAGRGPEPGPEPWAGPRAGSGERSARLPANAHFLFPGADGDALLFLLDAAGIAASRGSACRAGVSLPSHVLAAMGVDAADAATALRFTFGATSTPADVAALLAVLPDAVERARAAALGAPRVAAATPVTAAATIPTASRPAPAEAAGGAR